MCQRLKNCINRIQLFFFFLLYCLVQTHQLFLADADATEAKKVHQNRQLWFCYPLISSANIGLLSLMLHKV